MSRQTISLWENNQTVPSTENIKSLASCFGTSFEYFTAEEDNSFDYKTDNYKKINVLLSIAIFIVVIAFVYFIGKATAYL